MDDLTYDLLQMCRHNRDGGKTTQANRKSGLKLISHQLRESGFKYMKAQSLKPKHVQHLVERWQSEGLQTGTIMNRMSHLRWWAEHVGKAGLIPSDNAMLGIERREYANGPNRAKTLDAEKLEKITDEHIRLSLKLQQAFGLRREEAIKFQPTYADQNDHIKLKATWCKGGKERTIPIRNEEQRHILDEAKKLAKDGSLIPVHKSYVQQMDLYDKQCNKAGLDNMHGLRHMYAQTRYEELTGWKAPKAGGPSTKDLTLQQREMDRQTRLQISQELGHERIEVTSIYLGSKLVN